MEQEGTKNYPIDQSMAQPSAQVFPTAPPTYDQFQTTMMMQQVPITYQQPQIAGPNLYPQMQPQFYQQPQQMQPQFYQQPQQMQMPTMQQPQQMQMPTMQQPSKNFMLR